MTRPVKNHDLTLQLDAAAAEPLYQQISRAIVVEIQQGRLRPGTRLPGTRTLARTLAVHRNTVAGAYDELLMEGWAESARASGTFVSHSLPEVRPRKFSRQTSRREQVPARTGFDLKPGPARIDFAISQTGVLHMGGGISDVRLVPTAELARAFRRVLRKEGHAVLSYGDARGHPRLRAALASMLAATRGLATGPDDVFITQGSQMALDLVGRALIQPGDVIAVEDLGYAPAWEAFRQYGANLVPVPVDENGLDVAALERMTERTPVCAVYTTPHHQYPTTTTLTAGRRIALLGLARRKGIAVIEDDYDHEFHYEGRPVLPLASVDRAGVVVYIGTLAKILAPGLRLGYIVAPKSMLEHIAAHRLYLDRQGDHAVQGAVAELLEDGTLQRHARRARRVYHARRDFLVGQLRRLFGDSLSFNVPPGGMAIWAKIVAEIDVEAWAARALRNNVMIYTAKRFTFDGRARPCVRLGFASLNEDELKEAVKRLRSAI